MSNIKKKKPLAKQMQDTQAQQQAARFTADADTMKKFTMPNLNSQHKNYDRQVQKWVSQIPKQLEAGKQEQQEADKRYATQKQRMSGLIQATDNYWQQGGTQADPTYEQLLAKFYDAAPTSAEGHDVIMANGGYANMTQEQLQAMLDPSTYKPTDDVTAWQWLTGTESFKAWNEGQDADGNPYKQAVVDAYINYLTDQQTAMQYGAFDQPQYLLGGYSHLASTDYLKAVMEAIPGIKESEAAKYAELLAAYDTDYANYQSAYADWKTRTEQARDAADAAMDGYSKTARDAVKKERQWSGSLENEFIISMTGSTAEGEAYAKQFFDAMDGVSEEEANLVFDKLFRIDNAINGTFRDETMLENMTDEELGNDLKRMVDQYSLLVYESVGAAPVAPEYPKQENIPYDAVMDLVSSELDAREVMMPFMQAISSDPDFAEKSQQSRPEYEAYILNGQIPPGVEKGSATYKALENLIGNNINRTFLAPTEEDKQWAVYWTVNGVLKPDTELNTSAAVYQLRGKGYGLMTPMETAVFNYYFNSGDMDTAFAYLGAMEDVLAKRVRAMQETEWEFLATENALTAGLMGLASVYGNLLNPLAAGVDMVREGITGEKSPVANTFGALSQTARTAHDAALGEVDWANGVQILGKNPLQLLYGAGMSTLDMGTAMLLGGQYALPLMAAEAGANEWNEQLATDRPYWERVLRTGLTATGEVLTEKLPLDIMTGKTGLSGLARAAASAGSETAEEYASNKWGDLTDWALSKATGTPTQKETRENAYYWGGYANPQGMVRQEERRGEALDALLGGMTGFGMGATSAAIENAEYSRYGQEIIASEGADALVQIGSAMPADSETAKLIKSMTGKDGNVKPTAAKVGQLYRTMLQETSKQHEDSIRAMTVDAVETELNKRYEELGVEKETDITTRELAEAIVDADGNEGNLKGNAGRYVKESRVPRLVMREFNEMNASKPKAEQQDQQSKQDKADRATIQEVEGAQEEVAADDAGQEVVQKQDKAIRATIQEVEGGQESVAPEASETGKQKTQADRATIKEAEPADWVRELQNRRDQAQTDYAAKVVDIMLTTKKKKNKVVEASQIKSVERGNELAKAGEGKFTDDAGTGSVAFNSDGGEKTGSVAKFKRGKDGMIAVMDVATAEGKAESIEVPLDEITASKDAGVGTVISYIADAETRGHDMSASQASTMLHTYEREGGDAKAFITAFENAYFEGYIGAELSSSGISEGAAKVAYETGKAEAVTDESTRVAKAKRVRADSKGEVSFIGKVKSSAEVKGKGDTNALSAAMKGMTESQRTTTRIVQAFAEKFKTDVVLFESDADGIGGIENGSYNPNTNTLYIDINSGTNTAEGIKAGKKSNTLGYAMVRTLGHELTHHLESTSAEGYAAYKAEVKKMLKERGRDWALLVRSKMDAARLAGYKLTYAGAEAEVVADASEDILQNSKFVKEIDAKTQGRVKKFIKDFMRKLGEVFQHITGGHAESKALQDTINGVKQYMGDIQKLWDAAMEESIGREVSDGTVDAAYKTGEVYSYTAQNSLRVRDKETIEFLENQQHITTYRAMQVIDGKLYPPMAEFIGSKKDCNREDPGVIGRWEMSAEHPELIKWVDGKPKFELKKTNDDGSVSTVPAAYNPYMHSSNTVLNDQFSKAFQRKNLVVVECIVPVSESNGAYRAQYAKDATGWHEWKSGIVAGELAKQKSGFRRDVFLSRYIKPVRILPDSEVAEKIAGYLSGTDVTVPFQSVWPTLRDALVETGVKITAPRGLGSSQAKIAMEAYEEWMNRTSEQDALPVQMSSRDRQYMEAVDNSDMETAQKMVDEAAKEAGYDSGYLVYRADSAPYNTLLKGSELDEDGFSDNHGNLGDGLYFTPVRSYAERFKGQNGVLRKFYLKTDAADLSDPSVESLLEAIVAESEEYGEYLGNDELFQELRERLGKDGVKAKGVGGFSVGAEEIAVQESWQAKLADPVTYDNDGNVIPLSERFNEEEQDIRYSTRLLTKSEYGRFISNWNSRMNGNYFTPRNNGGVLIAMGDLLVYTDADGQPEHVLEVLTNDIETNNDIIQRAALLEAKGFDDEEQAEVLGRVFPEGSFRFRLPGDGERIEERNGRTSGHSIRKVRKAVRGEMPPAGEAADSEVRKYSLRDNPESISPREFLMEADDSIAATTEERNALSIYQKLLKNHAEASEAVMAAEDALDRAAEADKPEARKALTAARAKQKDIYNRLLNVERTAHVQTVVKRSQQIIGDLYGKNQAEVNKMVSELERKAESLRADLQGLKGAAKTQREADIREAERNLAAYKSKAAKALLENSEKYAKRMADLYERVELNTEISKKQRHIKRIVKRLNDRIIHEEDYKNVKEEMKPAVHKLVSTFIDGFGSMVFDAKTADRLRTVYDAIADDDGAPDFYSDDVANWLTDLASLAEEDQARRTAGGSTIESVKQKLDTYSKVAEIADHIYKMVTAADEIFINGKRESFAAISGEVGGNLVSRKDKALLVGKARDTVRVLDDLLRTGNLTPTYFFQHLKNSGLTKLFDNMMAGQTKYAQAIREGQEVVAEAKRKYGFYGWQNMKHGVEFRTEQGHTIALTVPQMMWVYATAKREATNKLMDTHHLDQGGFRYEASDLPRQKGKMSAIPGSDRLHKLSAEDVKKITDTLTAEQKACADELVSYLSNECAAQGNEASMEMFGIKKYNEEYYFPFKTASDQRYQRSDAGSTSTTNDARVKHTSFTHSLRKGANTALVMGDFFDVIADHINQMATYSSFVVPIESMNRVLNAKVNEDADGSGNEVTIRSLVARKYGESAQKYIADLMKDLNGGPQTDNRGTVSALFRAFKRGAVMGSLSVALQQPTAIARAFAYVNPKYFAHITMEGNKKTWERMMKYSGTAVIKDMGKFDVGTGKMANDWIANGGLQDYNVWKRGKFLLHTEGWNAVKNNWVEWATALPGVMDRVTWTHIWKAVEAEQADLNPGMDRNSDEFMKAVGKRFDDVINRTQVYDSILAKSQNMRSKNAFAQMSTAFMAEPTLNINMLYDAVANKHTAGQRAGIITSVVTSSLLAAAMASLIAAWNKDDDDRKLSEKYLAEFSSRAIDGVNPLTMIPYISDVWSMINGYDIERTDLSVVADVIEYTKSFVSKALDPEKSNTWRDYENFLGTFANLTGIPLKNWSRDVRRVRNFLATDKSASSGAALKYTVLESIGLMDDSSKAYCQRLVAAAAEGDTQEAYDLWDYLTNSKKPTQDTINTNVRNELKRLVREGKMTPEQATSILRKYAPYKNDSDNINKPAEWLKNK